MKIYRNREENLREMEENKDQVSINITRSPRVIEPCEFVFRFLVGEFLGTLMLTLFGAYLFVLSTQNLTLSIICMGALRFTLMHLLGDVCDVEFNPAISLGKLFIFQRQIFVGIAIIGGQFFGAFLGQVLFTGIFANSIVINININNTAEEVPVMSFQSSFGLEVICTLLFVIVFIKTNHYGAMAAVTTICMALSHVCGADTKAVGNSAIALAQSSVAAIWKQKDSYDHLDAVFAAAFLTPFLAAAVFWALNTVREMTAEESDSVR